MKEETAMHNRDMTEQQRIIWRTMDFLERLPYLLPEGEYAQLRNRLAEISAEMAAFKKTHQMSEASAEHIDNTLNILAARCRTTASQINHPGLYSIINYLHRAARQCERSRITILPTPTGENIVDFNAWRIKTRKRSPHRSGLMKRRTQAIPAERDGNVIYPHSFAEHIGRKRTAL